MLDFDRSTGNNHLRPAAAGTTAARASLAVAARDSTSSYRRSAALMGTVVTLEVEASRAQKTSACPKAVERAFAWFRRIEERCTRFEERSEVMRLAARPGAPVRVSTILYQAVQFAVAVAEESGGAFDPTVGYAMEGRGFDREYRTGKIIRTAIEPGPSVSYRDVRLDPDGQTITLLRPLILDLGAVAKGLAIDMAARELQPFRNFTVDAGGDLYVGGRNRSHEPWSVGIRHPRRLDQLIDVIRVSDRAVCTSGDYERASATEGGEHHILDPLARTSPRAVASVTVIAPTAILADAVATAAFVLGPTRGIELIERLGLEGLIFTPALERYATDGMPSANGC